MTKKEEMYQRIKKHGEDLKFIFGLPSSIDPIKLCKSLRTLELKANESAVKYCNGETDAETHEKESIYFKNKLNAILNNGYIPVFINGDPRGYSLKIDDDFVRRTKVNIHRDMGGYGIIAPDLR